MTTEAAYDTVLDNAITKPAIGNGNLGEQDLI